MVWYLKNIPILETLHNVLHGSHDRKSESSLFIGEGIYRTASINTLLVLYLYNY